MTIQSWLHAHSITIKTWVNTMCLLLSDFGRSIAHGADLKLAKLLAMKLVQSHFPVLQLASDGQSPEILGSALEDVRDESK